MQTQDLINVFVPWDDTTLRMLHPRTIHEWNEHRNAGTHCLKRWSLCNHNKQTVVMVVQKHYTCTKSPFPKKQCSVCREKSWRQSCVRATDLYFLVSNTYDVQSCEDMMRPYILNRVKLSSEYIDTMVRICPAYSHVSTEAAWMLDAVNVLLQTKRIDTDQSVEDTSEHTLELPELPKPEPPDPHQSSECSDDCSTPPTKRQNVSSGVRTHASCEIRT